MKKPTDHPDLFAQRDDEALRAAGCKPHPNWPDWWIMPDGTNSATRAALLWLARQARLPVDGPPEAPATSETCRDGAGIAPDTKPEQ